MLYTTDNKDLICNIIVSSPLPEGGGFDILGYQSPGRGSGKNEIQGGPFSNRSPKISRGDLPFFKKIRLRRAKSSHYYLDVYHFSKFSACSGLNHHIITLLITETQLLYFIQGIYSLYFTNSLKLHCIYYNLVTTDHCAVDYLTFKFDVKIQGRVPKILRIQGGLGFQGGL